MAEVPQNSVTTPTMAVELPFETITEILSRLPVKPLHRFKTVSKQWQTLISSPKFTRRHLKQTLTSSLNQHLLIINDSLVSAPITDTNLQFSELNHPLRNIPDASVALVETCDGLTLVYDCETKDMYLYNPACNSHRLLSSPPPPPTPSFLQRLQIIAGFGDNFFGFGYDSLSDDYKVVRLIHWIGVGRTVLYREAIVYSLRNDTWKFAKDETMQHFLQKSYAVAANDMLHYVALRQDMTNYVLKCFDLRTDTLLIVDFPELETRDFNKMSLSLKELRGCLSLLVNYHKPRVEPNVGVPASDPMYNRQLLYADVWVMRERGKKESWVKLFRIQQSEIVEYCMYLRCLIYSKNKRSLLFEVDSRWFGWYDLVTKRIRRVSVEGLRFEDFHSVASTYVESLVSVGSDKVVSKGRTMTPRKNIVKKKDDFLSLGFKLKL